MAAEDYCWGDDGGWGERYGEDDERRAPYHYHLGRLAPVERRCWRCHTSGLRWFNTGGEWRLHERKGGDWTPHRCPSSVGDLEDFS